VEQKVRKKQVHSEDHCRLSPSETFLNTEIQTIHWLFSWVAIWSKQEVAIVIHWSIWK